MSYMDAFVAVFVPISALLVIIIGIWKFMDWYNGHLERNYKKDKTKTIYAFVRPDNGVAWFPFTNEWAQCFISVTYWIWEETKKMKTPRKYKLYFNAVPSRGGIIDDALRFTKKRRCNTLKISFNGGPLVAVPVEN